MFPRPWKLPLIAFLFVGGLGITALTAEAQVWSNGYAYQRTITIDHTKVPNTDQSNFPVLISGTYSDLATTSNGGSVTNSNGYDIIFTSDSAGSTVLPFEQESYNASTGAITYWVQVPTVSHTTDTVFYLFYGKSSVSTDQSNKTGVWDSHYAGVWHFENGSTLSATDSTSNANNGTITGATATAGQIDGAAALSGSNQYIDVGNATSVQITGNSITVETWLKTSESNPAQYERVVTKEIAANANPYIAYSLNRIAGDNLISFGIATGGAGTGAGVNSVSSLSMTAWNHVVGTYDGAHFKIYVNGTLDNTASETGNIVSTSQHLIIGADTAAGQEYFKGSLDEVRVSNIARSSDWIAAEYANENSPSTFFSVGSGTVGSITPPNISSLSPTSGAAGASVTITGTSFGSTQGTSAVTFNGTTATVSSWSDTSIVVAVPATATSGPVLITSGSIASNSSTFTVLPTPTISDLSSDSGPVGISITVTGTNFGSTQGSSTITFSGTSASPTSWNATSIVVPVPTGATTGNVVITVGSVSSSGSTFTVTTGPGVFSLSPASGLAGTWVNISGVNFGSTQGSSTVTFNGASASVVGWSATSLTAVVPTGSSTGPFAVMVGGQSSNDSTFTVTPLPPGWNDSDVGSVGAAGSASFSNGTFTVSGSGFITGGSDTMNFAYQALSGDGTVVARLVSMSGSSGSGQAGVMIRETLNSNSTNALAGGQGSTSSSSINYWYRTSTSGTLTSSFYYTSGTPYWIKLIRSGSTISAYSSWDGELWTQVGSNQTITMATNVYVGLAVSSESGSSLTTATFDNVSITSSAAPTATMSSVFPDGGTVGTHVTISGSGFGASQENGMVVLSGTPLTITSWSDTSIVATIPSGVSTGPMAVVVAPDMIASNPELFVVGSALLSSWTDVDINGPSAAGTATYSSGVFSLGGGTYPYGGANFLFQPLTNDGTLIARVVSVSGTYGSGGPAVAGVMIRQTLDNESAYADATGCTGCDAYFYDVSDFNGSPNSQFNSGVLTLPVWLKLVRTANTFSTYVSADGVNWGQIGSSQAIAMNENVEAGLAVVDPNTGSTMSATFDNVSISNDTTPAPVIASLSTTTGPVGTEVSISGAGFGSTQGSSVAWLGSTSATVDTWSDTSITITVPTGATSGPVSVALAPGMTESNALFFTVTSNPLPSAWLDSDIGTVGIAGSASYTSGTFTLNASGNFIQGNGDQMHFVYQPLSGDGTITARVASLSGGAGSEQAGVMIRESLDAGSPNAFEGFRGVSSSSAIYFWERPTLSATTVPNSDSAVSLPYWVQVTRSGNTLTGYRSTDGATWIESQSATVTMDTNVYVGLALSSDTNTTLATATFDNVSFTLGSPSSTPVVNDVFPATGGVTSSVTITGSGFGATQGTSTVTFNGTPAYVVYWTNWEIVAVVPTTATTGSVVVTVGSQPSNPDFGFTVVDPQIYSLSPGSSPIGGSVVLTGNGFGATQGSSYLIFNGMSTAASVSSWSNTSIAVTVPSAALSGPVTVIVSGVFSNSANLIVTGSLSVTALSPTAGQVSTPVTITGTGFGSTQSASTVDFNGTVAAVSSWSNTSITAVVPTGMTSGPVNVTVAGLTATGPSFDISQAAYLTDSLGNTSTYVSTMIGGQWYVSSATGSGCSTCTLRGTTTIDYDGYGDVTGFTDPRGYSTSYSYDGSLNLSSITQPTVSAGTPTATYTYDDLGDVLTETDPLGHVTTNTYDANGNLLTVTTPAPASGVAATVTSFEYNSVGELIQITDPLSHVWTISYTSIGLIHTITDPQSNVTTYAYDSLGNRTSITDALTHVTSFTYDTMNRLTQITYPDSTTTSFSYDIRGRRTSVTDQNGKTTSYAYDDADRLTSVTDPASNVTTYGYDSESNLTSITDANSHSTSFTYDAYGRVTKTTFPSAAYETYAYDADNDLTSKTDRKGNTIDYVYDALNRLTSKTYPDTTAVEYTYDLVGKLMGVTDPSGTYDFSYDNMGRLTGTTANYSFLSGTTFTNAYSYNAVSNRTAYTAPDGSTNSYSYDTLNRMTTLANSATGSFGFSYDALSRRTQMTRPNGINTNYSYDSLSRLLSVLHQSGTSTIDGASYTLDSAGNRTAKTDDYASVTSDYTYDALYELTQVTQGGTTTESYSYDPIGNRTASLGVSSYTTNSSNEMTANSNASYTYDANGNTASNTDSTGTTDYAWDYENRMTSVTLPASAGTVTFKYDPFGRRIEKISPTTTSIFAYDGDDLVETTNSSGSEVASYTQGPSVDEHLAMLRGTTVSYYEQDGVGSVTSLTNSSGSPTQTYTYDAFGNQTASSGSLTNFFRYTGREFDTETNLYFYRARYYDQTNGRFLNEDAARFAGGTTFYEYAENDPTVFTDPSGNCPLDLNKFVDWLDKNAHPNSTEGCAKAIRLGLQAAGANTNGSPVPAKDWGPFLENNLGFAALPPDPAYSPQIGDIVVFQPANGSNPNGHIAAWDGTQWVSDFKPGPPLPNGTHFYPNLNKYGPQPYVIYRCK